MPCRRNRARRSALRRLAVPGIEDPGAAGIDQVAIVVGEALGRDVQKLQGEQVVRSQVGAQEMRLVGISNSKFGWPPPTACRSRG